MSNWKATKCCGTCALWDIESAKTKSGAVLSSHVKCFWVSTEQYPISKVGLYERPRAGYSKRDQGANCPCYVKREEKQK